MKKFMRSGGRGDDASWAVGWIKAWRWADGELGSLQDLERSWIHKQNEGYGKVTDGPNSSTVEHSWAARDWNKGWRLND
jgi:hypothetical protein